MADTVTSDFSLRMGFQREDESIQYLDVPNPYRGLTESEVREVMTYLTENHILLDSKTSSVLSETSILTAFTVDTSNFDLDLSQ